MGCSMVTGCRDGEGSTSANYTTNLILNGPRLLQEQNLDVQQVMISSSYDGEGPVFAHSAAVHAPCATRLRGS